MATSGHTTVGNALFKPSVSSPRTTPVQKPAPKPPNTNVATEWPLYNLYPPGPEWPTSQAVPTSQETGKGYDIAASRLETTRRNQLKNQANGQLLDGPGGYTFSLFVQGFDMDLQLAGSYGQSQYTRDFYPRNFVQPHVTIQGQSPSQEDYGILCEFVHACQHKAVANGYQNLTQLFIAGRNSTNNFSGRGIDGNRTDSTRVKINKPNSLMQGRTSDPTRAPAGTYYSQSIRGAHQPFMAKGYISAMQRSHKQFQYAVPWTMIFTIAAVIKGPFNDISSAQSLPNSAPVTWLDMLNNIKSTGATMGTPSLVKKNQQIVRAASTASINPLTTQG